MNDLIPLIAYWCDGESLVNLLCVSKVVKGCIGKKVLLRAALRRLLVTEKTPIRCIMKYLRSYGYDKKRVHKRLVLFLLQAMVDCHTRRQHLIGKLEGQLLKNVLLEHFSLWNDAHSVKLCLRHGALQPRPGLALRVASSVEVAKLLVEAMPTPNRGAAYVTLIKAAQTGNLPLVEYLLPLWGRDGRDFPCIPVFDEALENGHVNVVRRMLELRDVRLIKLYEPLWTAVKRGHIDAIRCVYEADPAGVASTLKAIPEVTPEFMQRITGTQPEMSPRLGTRGFG